MKAPFVEHCRSQHDPIEDSAMFPLRNRSRNHQGSSCCISARSPRFKSRNLNIRPRSMCATISSNKLNLFRIVAELRSMRSRKTLPEDRCRSSRLDRLLCGFDDRTSAQNNRGLRQQPAIQRRACFQRSRCFRQNDALEVRSRAQIHEA